MPRRAEPKTARDRIARVIAWAEQQGFKNIAADLREALALLPEPAAKQPKASKSRVATA
jgi:hypothetical protein